MRKGLFASLVTTLAWAGISLAQELPPAFSGPGSNNRTAPVAATIPALEPTAQPAPAAAASPAGLPTPGGACSGANCASGCGSSCGSAGCFPSCIDSCCNLPSRFYASADYLLWWVKSGPMPLELVTTGPFTGGLDGAFGTPGTTSLFGPTTFHYGPASGMRFAAGYWFDCMFGVEATGFWLEQRTSNFTASSDGSQVIAMPVIDAFTGKDFRFTIAAPDLRSGSISVASTTQLFGAELNGLVNLYQDNNFRLTGLYGFRWVELNESVVITGNSKALTNGLGDDNIIFNGAPLVNSSNAVVDSFGTRNSFYGFNLGARAEWTSGDWYVSATLKAAIGDSHEVISNSGYTTAVIGPGNGALSGTTGSYPYGRLVGPSNSGTFSRDAFAVVPEAEFKIGYQLTRYLKGYVGYNFMYLSNVVRPGDQISQVIDTRGSSTAESPFHAFTPGFTGTVAPTVPFLSSSFWAQGITAGLIFSY